MDRKPNLKSSPPLRLPPLNALRAFETAARHLSFAIAAKELHVTPAAISQRRAQLGRIVSHEAPANPDR